MRICYLASSHRVNGADALRGRLLVGALRKQADVTLSHAVHSEADDTDPDVMSAGRFLGYGFDLTVVEAGLFDLGDTTRVPTEVAEQYVRLGGVLILADVDLLPARDYLDKYLAVSGLFGCAPRTTEVWTGTEVVEGIDEVDYIDHPRSIRCHVPEMRISERLRPALAGSAEVLVTAPVCLSFGSAEILASANITSSTMASDLFIEKGYAFPWAGAKKVGDGYAVLLAGTVVHDSVVSRNPDNIEWLLGLFRFFVDDVVRERELYGAADSNPDQSEDIRRLVRDRERVIDGMLSLGPDEQQQVWAYCSEMQNSIEAELRARIVDVLGSDWRQKILSAVRDERLLVLDAHQDPIRLTGALYWLELMAVISKNWSQFELIFSDRKAFNKLMNRLNERHYAHAKPMTRADLETFTFDVRKLRSWLDGAAQP